MRNENLHARVYPPTQETRARGNLRLPHVHGPLRLRWGRKPMRGEKDPCRFRATSVQHPCAMTVWRLCSDAQTSVVTDKHVRLARCYGEFQLPGAGEFPMF